ncbi:hypothetical protein [Chitinilyticum litopenaei]|uniref:hypothetical protein n=1 Tax=Chitinilyticum litopenaei TaxID=1121276 RepID=UPI00042899FF|nr:hypothetical protein [Chitinilyticum litopenaei]
MTQKQKLLSALLFAFFLLIANVVIGFASRLASTAGERVSITAGMEELPELRLPTLAMDFASLGYVERAQQRQYHMHTGRVAPGDAGMPGWIDALLSFCAVFGLFALAKWLVKRHFPA